jgi:hypothetical protein
MRLPPKDSLARERYPENEAQRPFLPCTDVLGALFIPKCINGAFLILFLLNKKGELREESGEFGIYYKASHEYPGRSLRR